MMANRLIPLLEQLNTAVIKPAPVGPPQFVLAVDDSMALKLQLTQSLVRWDDGYTVMVACAVIVSDSVTHMEQGVGAGKRIKLSMTSRLERERYALD